MTPEEILALYGVDVSKLSTPYTSYRLAQSSDSWLMSLMKSLTTSQLLDGDLIVNTPDNFRSRIFYFKTIERHVNLDGPDMYIYLYHPTELRGTLRDIVDKYFTEERSGTLGTLAFEFDDVQNNVMTSYHVFITNDHPDAVVSTTGKDNHMVNMPIDKVYSRWGNKIMVQNYKDLSDPSFTHYGFVGD